MRTKNMTRMRGLTAVGMERHTGKESETAITRSLLTRLGRKAGEPLHQFPEQHHEAAS